MSNIPSLRTKPVDADLTRPNDVWFSNRKIPLITQPHNLPKMTEQLLSVERYEKWYDIYRIDPTTSVVQELTMKTSKAYHDHLVAFDIWHDHCIVPYDIIHIAQAGGYKMDLQTYDAICRRYIQDWMGMHCVFTKEFCRDLADRYDGSVDGRLQADIFPSEEDLQSVLVEHDILLTI